VQFYNQEASLNATPNFSPDGKQIYYSSTAAGHESQIYAANLNGTNFRRIGVAKAIQVEPKVNPKNGSQIAFVQGPKNQQIFLMNSEGANVERLTNGEGEASNPAWHPDGQHLLFAWTRGYATGNFNVFLMDTTTREYDQLTSNNGRNENPNWGPDGRHLVFKSNRSGSWQIWTMLANGGQVNRLTGKGNNEYPVWSK
jgi:TolB protein